MLPVPLNQRTNAPCKWVIAVASCYFSLFVLLSPQICASPTPTPLVPPQHGEQSESSEWGLRICKKAPKELIVLLQFFRRDILLFENLRFVDIFHCRKLQELV